MAFRSMSVRFWKDKELCWLFVCRSGLPTTDLTGELCSLVRLLSVTSTGADIVACSGAQLRSSKPSMNQFSFPVVYRAAFDSKNWSLPRCCTNLATASSEKLIFFRTTCFDDFPGMISDWGLVTPQSCSDKSTYHKVSLFYLRSEVVDIRLNTWGYRSSEDLVWVFMIGIV